MILFLIPSLEHLFYSFMVQYRVLVLNLCGYNSVVECNLAKVEVVGSNPITRSNILPKRRRRQVVRSGTANPVYVGSNPTGASIAMSFSGQYS